MDERCAAVRAIGRQLRAKSVVLLSELTELTRQSPSPCSPGEDVRHCGTLLELTGRGILQPGAWRRRFCVLDSRRLYCYPINEAGAYREKTSEYLSLDAYDVCEEATGPKLRDIKKSEPRGNVFVLSSTGAEKSLFDTSRAYFSAETSAEMNEWISQIRSAMTSIREGRNSPTPAPRRSKTPATPASEAVRTSSGPVEVASSTPRPRTKTLEMDNLKPTDHLDCVTRQRAKGPAGRRLPRNVRVAPTDDMGHRSESLPRLEADRSGPGDAVLESINPANVPDHSDFDQGWFMGDRARVTRVPAPPSPAARQSITHERPAVRLVNRYWTCHLL